MNERLYQMVVATKKAADSAEPFTRLVTSFQLVDSEASFSRAFKRLMGVSPAAWRRARVRAGGAA